MIPGAFHQYHAHIFPMITNTKGTQEILTVIKKSAEFSRGPCTLIKFLIATNFSPDKSKKNSTSAKGVFSVMFLKIEF